MDDDPDHYAVLGIPRDADEQAVRGAYRRLARQWHPDANPFEAEAADRFRRIQEAYDVLGDPEQRKAYDATGRAAASNDNQNGPEEDLWTDDWEDEGAGGASRTDQRAAASSLGDPEPVPQEGRSGFWDGDDIPQSGRTGFWGEQR